ncbi:MAG TPA: hypothetical protein VG890_10355 [Puia sp.]|nr:hypothetical protein [Puia sp.]
MKAFACLMFSICFAISASGQATFNDSLALSRNRLTKDAMLTLGGWAVANIASGFIIASQTHGEAHYAWQMNAYWNFINLGLAGMGYLNARRAMRQRFGLADNVKAQQSIEKLYVFNLGLDLVYITGGFYLRERGNRESKESSRDQFKGYGTSIAIQGGFLLLMDGVMIMLHHKNTVRLNNRIRQLELNAGPGGLGLIYHFKS